MAAGEYNFTGDGRVEQGATLDKAFDFFEDDGTTPINLTGLKFRMHVRTTVESETVIAEFVSSGLSPDGDADANGTLSLGNDSNGNTNNRVTMNMSAAQTALIPGGRYKYDLESVSADATPVVIRWCEGVFQVISNVTRPV